MSYMGSSISLSPTVSLTSAEDIPKAAGRVVRFDSEGNITLCKDPRATAVGIVILNSQDDVKARDSVTVQIAGRGIALAGGAFDCGSELSVDSDGRLVASAEGQFVMGYAFSKGVSGRMFQIQICKSYKPSTQGQ